MLSSTDNLHHVSALSWSNDLAAAGIIVAPFVAFAAKTKTVDQLDEIRHSGVRVVLVLAYGGDTRHSALQVGLVPRCLHFVRTRA